MDVVADVGIVGVQSAVRAVAEPVGVVVIAGLVLPEDDFPQGRMEIGVDGIEDGLSRGVRGRQTFVMRILIFMKNVLCDRPEEI